MINSIIRRAKKVDIRSVMILSAALHAFLIIFGEVQESTLGVKYTDIDYSVFTDAARHVTNGGSPFDRHTYRYTPLLAWLLVPNILVTSVFGKVLFSVFDLLVGWMIYRISGNRAHLAALWLLSPVTLNVASRGSCDSLICVVVLSLLYYADKGQWDLAAIALGLGVHLRLYPIVFVLPLMMKIRSFTGVVRFGLISGGLFLGLLALFWHLYGWTFVYETYLYHFVRKDHRHNFSLFFYPIYLLSEHPEEGRWLSLITFVPQMVSLVGVGFLQRPLHVIALLQTLIFVAFNKVMTAQYFTWFLCLLPLAVPYIRKPWTLASLVGVWLAAELHWLFWGFHLEIEGSAVFMGTFWASVIFFASHIVLICYIIRATRVIKKD